MSHYAANFVIYAATGINFRSELRSLVRRAFPSCLVTCFRCAAETGNGNTTTSAAATFEMRQTDATLLDKRNERRSQH